MKGLVEFDKIEKDFKYTREYMGLIQDIGLLDTEEFSNTKEDQEVNIREVLDQCSNLDQPVQELLSIWMGIPPLLSFYKRELAH